MSKDATQTIELDAGTVRQLQEHASERGITVAEMISELLPLAPDEESVAELDRRWAAACGAANVPHEQVERWLRSWGTPAFKAWREK